MIALFGFADRETVTLAKAAGPIACLELPYHVDDLIDVIDRAARRSHPSAGRSRRGSSNLIVCRHRPAAASNIKNSPRRGTVVRSDGKPKVS